MAKFCLLTQMSPSEYKALTLQEYRAFTDAWNELNEVRE